MLTGILILAVLILFLRHRLLIGEPIRSASLASLLKAPAIEVVSDTDKSYIKWVDFNVTCEAMTKAYTLDVESYDKDVHLNWIELLAYAGAKGGGSFDKKSLSTIDKLALELSNGETTIQKLTKDMKYYDYYYEAYEAVLGGMVGEYEIEQSDEADRKVWKKVYGLKAFSPIAKGFPYSDYDDFGSSRSYGYKRQHLGHDMMGQIGTPVVAIESGYVEALGWNQYGGWRIGIRSDDTLRYYYYAHLQKDHPYAKGLEVGSRVQAGDVIGFMGRTGYSTRENVNNINTVHLHFGLELVFDESQKECDSEIWVDVYSLVELLSEHRSSVRYDKEQDKWVRLYPYRDLDAE